MKRIIAMLMVFLFIQLPVFAEQGGVSLQYKNEEYSKYIKTVIEKSSFGENYKNNDSIYVIEYIPIGNILNKDLYKFEINEVYIVATNADTNEKSYAYVDWGHYYDNNPGPGYGKESGIDNDDFYTYLKANGLESAKGAVQAIYVSRVKVNAYRVFSGDKVYAIPYHIGEGYNPENQPDCNIEIGKAYEEEKLSRILSNEIRRYNARIEQEKAAKRLLKTQSGELVIADDEEGNKKMTVGTVDLIPEKELMLERMQNTAFNTYVRVIRQSDDEWWERNHYYKSNANKQELIEFVEGMYEVIEAQQDEQKEEYDGYISSIVILKYNENGVVREHQTHFSISNNTMTIKDREQGTPLNVTFPLNNPSAVVQYIRDFSENGFATFEERYYDKDNAKTMGSIEGDEKKEFIEFEFAIPVNDKTVLSEEIGEAGEKISGILERYKESRTYDCYVLTLSGSKGSISMYETVKLPLDAEQEYMSDNLPLNFINTYRVEGERLCHYQAGRTTDRFSLKTVFSGGKLSEVRLNDKLCENAEYTALAEDSKMSDKFVERSAEEYKNSKQEKEQAKENESPEDETADEEKKEAAENEDKEDKSQSIADKEIIVPEDDKPAFTDVPESHWAYDAIQYFYRAEVLEGMGDGSFSPESQVTREQLAKMISVIYGKNEDYSGKQTFNDVSKTRWSYEYIESVKDYLTGYFPRGGSAFYNPSAKAVREDVAYALIKISGLYDDASKNIATLEKFTDKDKVSPSLRSYVSAAIEMGLMEGYNNELRPQDGITRAETAALLFRAIKKPVEGK